MQFLDAKGAHIPILGLGTWQLRGRDCVRLVEQAIRLGYRHFDTAQMYGNERDVGEGIRASGIKREEIFVVTKVAPDNLAPRLLERSVKDSVGALRLGEIDLLLLHWPNKGVPLKDTIDALVGVKRDGFVRHIGVSNYTIALIEEASRLSDERLVCNQIECHPFLDQSKVIAACRKHEMAVVAYSPIAQGNSKNDALLSRIGKAHGKSAAQVSLRYLIQQGIGAIPRTSKVERLAENIAIFDFELSDDEMRAIADLARPDGRLTDWGVVAEMGLSVPADGAALVLFSGGQDSTICLAWALERFARVETIGFAYGQRHAIELAQRPVIRDRLRALKPQWRERLGDDHTIDLPALGAISETALTRDVAIALSDNGLPTTFVPGRNLIFLAFAGALAYRRGTRHLVAGMCETDYSGYPDCRDQSIKAMQTALNLGMDCAFILHTPLMWIDKAASFALADEIGGDKFLQVVVENTHSCYLGERSRRHIWGYGCGECPACQLRAAGYAKWEEECKNR